MNCNLGHQKHSIKMFGIWLIITKLEAKAYKKKTILWKILFLLYNVYYIIDEDQSILTKLPIWNLLYLLSYALRSVQSLLSLHFYVILHCCKFKSVHFSLNVWWVKLKFCCLSLRHKQCSLLTLIFIIILKLWQFIIILILWPFWCL